MPRIYLSPSTQEYNPYVTGNGSEEYFMNLVADAMEPYLLANGIQFSRNTPDMTAASSIRQANRGDYDFYLALHSNASGPRQPGSEPGHHRLLLSHQRQRAAGGGDHCPEHAGDLSPAGAGGDPAHHHPGRGAAAPGPAVLVEIGYHDNEADARWIESHIDAIGQNLAMSMAEYFGLPFTYPGPSQPGVIVTESGGPVNLRAEPSVTGRVLTRIPSGETVTVFGQYRGWYVVLYGDTLGYVSAPYVQI